MKILSALDDFWRWFADRKSRRDMAWKEHETQWQERLLSPDFSALRSRFGESISLALLNLYSNKEELLRTNVTRRPFPGAKEDEFIDVAWYIPADEAALNDQWEGNEGVFEFGDDGLGNRYLVDPRLPDPPILLYDHEEKLRKETGMTLSGYLQTDPEQT